MNMLIGTLILMLCTLPLAHWIGHTLAKRRAIKVGHIREAMPSLPVAPPIRGRAEQRWDKNVNRVEGMLLEEFGGEGARGVRARELAATLGQDPLLVEAALAKLREEIPCRMQILRSGEILHDFEAKDIAALQSARRRAWPMQVLLTLMAALANVGAAWPFIAVGGVSAFALWKTLEAPTTEAAIALGVAGVGTSFGLLAASFILGWLMQALLYPFGSGVTLGKQKEGEPETVRHSSGFDASDVILWNMAADSHRTHTTSSWGGSSSSEGEGWLDLEDAGQEILVVILVAVLAAIVAASLVVILVWLRGLWRAARRLGEPTQATSPTTWVRQKDNVDRWERYIPTNDIVIRMLHALRRQINHHRPPDQDLAARVLALAKQKRGVITGLDLVFHEGFNLDEAHQIGARLTGMLDGQILVDNEGELAFAFPNDVLRRVRPNEEQDMQAEYLTLSAQNDSVRRRRNQDPEKLPVNLVGLNKGHLDSSGRLVAGTYLMVLMMVWALAPGTPDVVFKVTALNSPALMWLLMFMGIAICLATASMVTASKYMAIQTAKNGVRRDVRRATFGAIQHAVARGERDVDLTNLVERLTRVFATSWTSIERDLVQAEVRGVAVDLELEPSADLTSMAQEKYQLEGLRRRMQEDQEFAQVFDFEGTKLEFEQQDPDEVVFDTKVEVAEVSALGRA